MSQTYEDCVFCGKNQEVTRQLTKEENNYLFSFDCTKCGNYFTESKTNISVQALDKEKKQILHTWVKKQNSLRVKPHLKDGISLVI